LLHQLTTVELVVDQEACKIVSKQAYGDVKEIVFPVRKNVVLGFGPDNRDELALEEFISVKEYVVAEPCTGRSNDASAEVPEGKLERLDIVARDVALSLGSIYLPICVLHFEGTIVGKCECANCRNSERYAVSSLNCGFKVWLGTTILLRELATETRREKRKERRKRSVTKRPGGGGETYERSLNQSSKTMRMA
jgi:hypothetical protein